jgi:predicted transcriptional regulator
MSGKDKETKPPARENIVLKKVETKRQEVKLSEKEIGMMKNFEKTINPKGDLSNDEITLINIMEKQKLLLERIVIKFNQSRQALAMSLLKAKDFETLINSLVSKGIMTSRDAPAGKVFYLTEAGLEFLDLL